MIFKHKLIHILCYTRDDGFLWNSQTNSIIFCATPAECFFEIHTQARPYFVLHPQSGFLNFTHKLNQILTRKVVFREFLTKLNRILCFTRNVVFCKIHKQTEPYFVLHPNCTFTKLCCFFFLLGNSFEKYNLKGSYRQVYLGRKWIYVKKSANIFLVSFDTCGSQTLVTGKRLLSGGSKFLVKIVGKKNQKKLRFFLFFNVFFLSRNIEIWWNSLDAGIRNAHVEVQNPG